MRETEPRVGESVRLAAGLVRLTAPNPSPMTGPGTNSYIVGRGPYAVVDPGVEDSAHLDALWAAAHGNITAVLLTHRHPDHASGAHTLAERAGAPLRAWPKAHLGTYDRPVTVDQPLVDSESLAFGGERLTVRHMPGHAADHVCFELPDSGIILAGDCVMADATVVILPPDGSMSDYFASLQRLAVLSPGRLAPAHGRVIPDPGQTIAAVLAHRRERERQVADALSATESATAETIAHRLYPELDGQLLMVAVEQVRAHLVYLMEQNRVIDCGAGWRAAANRPHG